MADGEAIVAPSSRGVRVLLVEDEFLICDMITEALTKRGFEVHAAANAHDALEHLTCGAPCDLLLTDLNLGPGMDGVALAQRVRELRPDLPVVYASGTYHRLDEFAAVPGATFLPKPYNPDRLCTVIRQMQRAEH